MRPARLIAKRGLKWWAIWFLGALATVSYRQKPKIIVTGPSQIRQEDTGK
jgi:hypothetical protein